MRIILMWVALMVAMPCVWAQEAESVTIVIKDHRFMPAEVVVPANRKLKLIIDNQDPTPEEFESYPLNREKVISGRTQGLVYIGPLAKGVYEFIGEFHKETARGQIVAK